MRYLLDTNILIDMVDAVDRTLRKFDAIAASGPAIAAIAAAELEASIFANAAFQKTREPGTRALLEIMPILPFDAATARRYGNIVATCGYNRRKAIDRMIAATALENGLTLITRNPDDFADIAELSIENWS